MPETEYKGAARPIPNVRVLLRGSSPAEPPPAGEAIRTMSDTIRPVTVLRRSIGCGTPEIAYAATIDAAAYHD